MTCEANGSMSWEAIGAMSTAAAAIIALGASWLALRAPEWSRKAERRAATEEVLRAVKESLAVYRGAAQLVANNSWPDELTSLIRIRATHLHATLDRLLNRPSLTDGAIAIGAGAMSILAAIINIPNPQEARDRAFARSHDIHLARFVDIVGPAKIILDSAGQVVGVIENRVSRVETFMARRWWSRFKRRRNHADFEEHGETSDSTPLHN